MLSKSFIVAYMQSGSFGKVDYSQLPIKEYLSAA